MQNAWKEWLEIPYADESWLPSKIIQFRSQSVDFPTFGACLTRRNRLNLGFPCIFFFEKHIKGMAWNFYVDYLQKRINFGHGRWIFYFCRKFDLTTWVRFGPGFPGIFWDCMEGMNGLKFLCWNILTTFTNDLNFGHGILIVLFWCPFDLVKWVKIGVPVISLKRYRMNGLADDIWHDDVPWHRIWGMMSVDFAHFWRNFGSGIWGKFGAYSYFPQGMEGMAWNLACLWLWSPSEIIRFWSWSHFTDCGVILT